MPSWPKPIYHDSSWETAVSKADFTMAEELLSVTDFNPRDGWRARTEGIRIRTIQYPFYPGVRSLEILLPLPFGEGHVLGAWMVSDEGQFLRKANGPTLPTSDAPSTYFLDGTSPPIHELNGKLPISIRDGAAAADYLRFFTAHVWGEAGGFYICDDRSNLPWTEGAQGEVSDRAGQLLKPFCAGTKASPSNEFWTLDAVVLYGRGLFAAQFEVEPGGMVRMLDDNGIMNDLPLHPERRESGFRKFLPGEL